MTHARTFQHRRLMDRITCLCWHDRWSLGGVALLAILVGTIHQLVSHGMLIGNHSPSVPPGLYIASSPHTATYVSFCLRDDHIDIAMAGGFCHTANPDGTHILKRIVRRHTDQSLTVTGATAHALDSRVLGDITPRMIHGWWQPLWTWEPLW